MKSALRIVLSLAYPVFIYAALGVLQPRQIALITLFALALRVATMPRARLQAQARALGPLSLAVAFAIMVSALRNDPFSLLVAPAIVSFSLMLVFGHSLTRDESIVERFARAQSGSLSDEQALYCRRVTTVWCGFFLLNACVVVYLALWGSLRVWASYTGGVAYLLIGLLFASEFVYRQWRFREYQGAPWDFLFRRVFPPRA